MHGTMATNLFLHTGTIFPNKLPHCKANTHEIESTEQFQNYTISLVHVTLSYPSANYLISNLCCALSMSWFTLRTIFSKLAIVIYTLIFFRDFVEFVWYFNRHSFLSIYCTWFTLQNFSLLWGLLRLTPIIPYSSRFFGILNFMCLFLSYVLLHTTICTLAL